MGKRFWIAAVLAALVCLVSATSHIQFERQTDSLAPEGWDLIGKSSSSKTIKLQIAIKQSNDELLKKILQDVSDPRSKNYGHYLSTEEIGALVSPPAERLDRIHNWLEEAKISPNQCQLSLHKDFLTVRLSISQAETLLKTSFDDYQSIDGRIISRTRKYFVPSSLAQDIDFIGGTIRFPPLKKHTIRSAISRSIGKPDDFYSQSRLLAPLPLPTGYGPVLSYLLIGDKEATVDLLIRCPDGSAAQKDLNCNGNQVAALSVQVGPAKHIEDPINMNQCRSSYASGILGTSQANLIQKYTLPKDSVFCTFKVTGIPNFINHDASVTAFFTKSSNATTVLPVVNTAPWVNVRVLQDTYRIPSQLRNTQSKNGQSVSEFLGQYYNPQDLSNWMALMGLDNYKVDKVIGPNNPSNPGLEATLDIQYMLGISNNVTTWFWSLGDLHEGQEPFLEWLIDLSNTPNPPFVHSTSYADEEQSLTADYMQRVNTELVKAGLRGLTLLFSSGDDGVGGYTLRTKPQICQSRGFAPEFPSSSPYVTAVGGTQFSDKYLPICAHPQNGLDYGCHGIGEIVSSSSTGSRITSGGGFSINFERPSYQKEAVMSYFTKLTLAGQLPDSKLWNPNGRAFPDISGMAHNYLCLIGGDIIPVDGTSASTPLTAAMLTLINDKLIALGKPTLGFFNPLLYQLGLEHPEAFTDVVVGNNACSAVRGICCSSGFEATPGWDATTGFGVPVFDRLYQLITGVPPL